MCSNFNNATFIGLFNLAVSKKILTPVERFVISPPPLILVKIKTSFKKYQILKKSLKSTMWCPKGMFCFRSSKKSGQRHSWPFGNYSKIVTAKDGGGKMFFLARIIEFFIDLLTREQPESSLAVTSKVRTFQSLFVNLKSKISRYYQKM